LPTLRRLTRGAAGQRRRAQLELIARAARDGEDIGPLLRAAGLLDDEPDTTTVPRDSEHPPPTAIGGPGKPVSGDYVCPDSRCTRVERRGPSQPVPECEVLGKTLRLVTAD
jgi:hypothetical protein